MFVNKYNVFYILDILGIGQTALYKQRFFGQANGDKKINTQTEKNGTKTIKKECIVIVNRKKKCIQYIIMSLHH